MPTNTRKDLPAIFSYVYFPPSYSYVRRKIAASRILHRGYIFGVKQQNYTLIKGEKSSITAHDSLEPRNEAQAEKICVHKESEKSSFSVGLHRYIQSGVAQKIFGNFSSRRWCKCSTLFSVLSLPSSSSSSSSHSSSSSCFAMCLWRGSLRTQPCS